MDRYYSAYEPHTIDASGNKVDIFPSQLKGWSKLRVSYYAQNEWRADTWPVCQVEKTTLQETSYRYYEEVKDSDPQKHNATVLYLMLDYKAKKYYRSVTLDGEPLNPYSFICTGEPVGSPYKPWMLK